jgi:hypothetical protein
MDTVETNASNRDIHSIKSPRPLSERGTQSLAIVHTLTNVLPGGSRNEWIICGDGDLVLLVASKKKKITSIINYISLR